MKNSKQVLARRALAFAVAAVFGGSEAVCAQGLEEVLVTAQKREQGLQEVPISVEAFSAEQIDNLAAEDISDLGTYAPNVEISKAGTQPSYTIRGIGTSDFGIGADPAVGVYVDGIYVGRSGGSKVAFNDIARIEILNGPQGTLFGRNAAAGAIQYVTNKPEDDQYGWAKLTMGNYDRRQMEGLLNTALTDELYFRGGLLWNRRDGWATNVVNGDDLAREHNKSVNGQLRWLPSDRLDVILRVEYDEIDQDPRPASSAVLGPRDHGAAFTRVASDEQLVEQRYLFGSSLHLSYDMSVATLTAITSWRSFNASVEEEKDGSAELLYQFTDLNEEKNKQFGQELRLDGEWGDRFRWTVGGSYHWEHARQTSSILLSPYALDKLIAEREIGVPYASFTPGQAIGIAFAFIADPYGRRAYANGQDALLADVYKESIYIDGDFRSTAVFTDVTYDITEQLSLTGGVRYTRDKKEFARYVEFNDFALAFGFPTETRLDASGNYDPNGELGPLVSQDQWSELTPRVVLDWELANDVMAYASYAQGYKAGGFNSAGEILAPSFDPEQVTNFELGIKSSWLDNTLRVNAAWFSYEYDNLQALEFIQGACLPGTNVGSYQFETSDVEGDGFELSATWLPIDSLELFFNTGFLDAQYTRREERQAVAGGCEIIDRSGEDFAQSPDLSFSLGGTYSLALATGAELTLSAAYNYSDGLERNSCVYVVDNRGSGDTSDVYEFTEIDGKLTITDASATGDLTAVPFDHCPDTGDRQQLNARLVYISPARNWELAAFVINATDWEPDENSSDPGGLGGELASGFSDGSPAWIRRDEPRMYGVELRYNF